MKSYKTLLLIGLTFASFIAYSTSVYSQEYVDAPVEPLNEESVTATTLTDPGTFHQFSSGYLGMGWEENVFYQFTGEDVFKGGSSPVSFFMNLQYETVMSPNLPVPFLKAVSVAFEWSQLKINSEYVAFKEGVNPDLELTLDNYGFSVKAYFMNDMEPTDDPFKMLKLYAGLGWGWLDGEFTGTNVKNGTTQSIDTSVYGLYTYREFGVSMIGKTFGGSFSFKMIRADQTKTSGDPFNQAEEGEKLIMDFGGISTTLTAIMRF